MTEDIIDIRHEFSFQRMGGINQALLATDYDWRHLDDLDPKLWMALSCPTEGLEFNPETLKLLDSGNDGRIRAREVKAAVAWLCERLEHPAKARDCVAEVRLENLRSDTEAGRSVASALKLALSKSGKKETDPLTLAESEKVLAEAAGYPFNGDGVVTAESAKAAGNAADIGEFIRLGLAIAGGKKDASGLPGLDESLAAELAARARAALEWRSKSRAAQMPLGDRTGEAWSQLGEIAPRLDDFFRRCQLAAFAPETLSLLNEEKSLENLAASQDGQSFGALALATLETLPIARINAKGALDLNGSLNPAWAKTMALFRENFAPLLPKNGILTNAVWADIKSRFAEYAAILDQKPSFPAAPQDAARETFPGAPELALAAADDPLGRFFAPVAPDTALDALDDAKLNWLASPKTASEFSRLAALDLEAPPLASFQDLRKLALFNGHLYTFLMNFLSFLDFYDPKKKAIFQSGTLYLDSRGCMLCVPVEDIDAHARLANPSHLCLIYCQCSRREADGAERKLNIAAALTEGNLAGLLDGRHGLFIDNAGREWDTRIARIVHNPVSIREAVWSPYIRIANMISEQLQKFVSTKDQAIGALTSQTAANIANLAKGAKPAEKGGFDFAKGAGIFAAVSVALSVVSAAFAYIAHSVASLGWWWPLALVGVFLCISAPSVFLAWLKLRRRSLGPLLDASGWAVNQGAPINLTMGASLTSIGKLPPNAHCDPNDPYSLPGQILRKKWRTRAIRFCILLFLLLCLGGFVLYCAIYGEPVWLFRLRAMTGI